jgi:hypothetical protein
MLERTLTREFANVGKGLASRFTSESRSVTGMEQKE